MTIIESYFLWFDYSKAFSSKTGSSDLALQLGINTHAPPEVVKDCVKEIKLTCWASECVYPWMSPLISTGKKEQIQNIMPMLYSLRLAIASALNPFSLKRQVRGVSKPFTQTIAQVLSNCGYEKALVVLGHGEKENIRIDEISNLGKTIISELKPNGEIETYQICPEDLGIKKGEKTQILSRDSHFENAKIIYEILSGKDTTSRKDLILINSAAILYTADKVKNLKDGYQLSKKTLEEGKALEKLWQLVTLSRGRIDKLKTIIGFN